MKKLGKPCKLPKNHREYYYLEIDSKTKKQKQIYPNLFIDLVSIQINKKEKANEQNQK